jgi:AcrR family transcriptional regulator
MASQLSRPRRTRGSLTPSEILAAAEIVAARSVDPLTIRAVATELAASPMALYRYFPTKDDLVDALLDTVLQRIDWPQPADWLDELRELALAHARLLAEHPWAVVPLFESPSPGAGATAIGERYLEILARGGITGADAIAAFSGILALTYGGMAFIVRTNGNDERSGLGAYTSDDNYRRALEIFLNGLNGSAP